MTDLVITKINDVWMKVQCAEIYMEMDLHDEFSFKVPGSEFDPRVKRGQWDGIKKLYNRRTKKMYAGLLFKLLNVCDKKGWSTYIDPDLLPSTDQLEDEDIHELIQLFRPHDDGKPIDPYDYQIEAIKYMINMNRSVVLAATSAGKSLIMYIVSRIYQLLDETQTKTIFIVVPSISLVEQMYSDFDNYSSFKGSNWSVNAHCQKISNKYSKQINQQIVITTWQSMCKLPYDIYENLGVVFVDETHTASASVLVDILERCTNTSYRHGLTGTLSGAECNELVIQGLLGPAKRIVTAKEIIDQGRAADIEVRMSLLDYPQSARQQCAIAKANTTAKQRFQKEVEFVNAIDYRRKFIMDMVSSIPGNSLVLFDRVEDYGQDIYEAYKELHPNTFLIIGGVDVNDREDIRQSMEQHDDAVIFASYGTMQQGVSIKKLHNLFLISSSKSVIRVLQSIGRMMRLHHTKEKSRIFDIVDDLSFDGKENYMMLHAQERIKMYNNEQFHIHFDKYDMRSYINVNESIDQFM